MLSNATILLAEDNSDDVLILRRAFRKANITHSLVVVTDGQQAIDYLDGSGAYQDLQRYPIPSLIILDLKMPHKSGFDVLEWISHNQSLRSIPTVVLSSSDEQRDTDRAYRLGARDYLIKPPSREKLLELMALLASPQAPSPITA